MIQKSQSSCHDLSDIIATNWVNFYLPNSWKPYARLCRIDRPIGIWLILFPCLAALIQAANNLPSMKRLVVFSIGAFLMRGIGCTINDIFDRNFDKKTERTRFRPLANNQISVKKAILFLVFQLLICSLLLYFINYFSCFLSIMIIPIVFIYPIFKRITYWPQILLGVCFNWGILIAWCDTQNKIQLATIILWLGTIFWQMGYDSIYAYVDIYDDKKSGIYSTALFFKSKGRKYIGIFYFISTILWILSGYLIGINFIYYIIILFILLHFIWQISHFNTNNPNKNFKLFHSNIWVGSLLMIASLGGVLINI